MTPVRRAHPGTRPHLHNVRSPPSRWRPQPSRPATPVESSPRSELDPSTQLDPAREDRRGLVEPLLRYDAEAGRRPQIDGRIREVDGVEGVDQVDAEAQR